MHALEKLNFKLKEETLQRCKVIELNDEVLSNFVPVSPELFHFLYETKEVNFNIYFRVEHLMIEFIKSNEFSRELLDQMWSAMQKNRRRLEIHILRKEHFRFTKFIEGIRANKITRLVDKHPHLDRKVLDVFTSVSNASQLIVKGGITNDVVDRVTATASLLVNNLLDSTVAIATLSKMVTADPTLYDHSASVAMIASMIAQRGVSKKLNNKQIEIIAKCGMYHDVGKTCVPSAILNKPGKFSPEEFEVMKSHTTLGENELFEASKHCHGINHECSRVAGEHHEKFAGGGYPRGRKGRHEQDPENGIHLYTRIVSIADVYSALLMKRVYKSAYEPQDAIKIMTESADRDFDPAIFNDFLKLVVSSLNEYQGKSGSGKGRILYFDEEGNLKDASVVTPDSKAS